MGKSSKLSHLNTVFEHFKFIDDNFNFLIGCISESGAKPGDIIYVGTKGPKTLFASCTEIEYLKVCSKQTKHPKQCARSARR